MTAHTHTKPVEGCFRCELGADEAAAARNQQFKDILNGLFSASEEKLDIIELVLDL